MTASSVAGNLAEAARLDDVAFYLGDPYPTYARLRREAPVYWCESGGFWALTRHDDIKWAESQPNPPLTTSQGMYIAEAKDMDRVAARDLGGAQQSGVMFMSDPPGHTTFRHLISKGFTVKRMTELEPRVSALVDELLDALPVGEPVEFVESVSVPLAVRTIAELLGLPQERWQDLRRWTDAFMLFIGGGLAEGSPEALQAMTDMGEMHGYFAETLAERRDGSGDDLLSAIAKLDVDGEPLPIENQIMICLSVLVAGNDTTRNTVSGTMITFTKHPLQWERFLGDPSLAKSATEELLRWISPVTHFGRRATEPIVIRGQEIAAGDFVVMLYGAANRDEDVWPDADVFDITRPDAFKHLSFGWGLHLCIGAALGRLQVRLVLEALARRYSSWEIVGEVTRNPTMLVNDYTTVPVLLKGK